MVLTAVYIGLGQCGLQFSAVMFNVTVTETPASDSDTDPNPPTPVSGVVLTAVCTQSDGNPVADSSDLRYSVIEGDMGVFSIDAMSGQFSVADQPFDYEEEPWYLVSLLCYLDSDPSTNGTGAVNVTIGPVNEYLPQIMGTTSHNIVQLHEDAPVGITVATKAPGIALLTYTSTDRDSGPGGTVSFTLSPAQGSSAGIFELNANTGTLTLQQKLDVDNLPGNNPIVVIQISITACNEGLSTSECNSIILTVYITPANDNEPQFLQADYSETVLESAQPDTIVVQVTCVDDDKGAGMVEGVAFDSETKEAVASLFDINSTLVVSEHNSVIGAVVLRGSLDYEEGAVSYQFQVVCSDGVTEARAQVSVVVLPVNDNPPHFTEEHYQFSVQRSSPAGHSVGRVQAVDEDIAIGSNITYSIQDSTNFNINPQTGEITIEDDIPSSRGSQFDLEVFASDGDFVDNSTVHITVEGALSAVEFAAIVSGVCIFILLVVIVILLFGSCCCCYIRATRTRYIQHGI